MSTTYHTPVLRDEVLRLLALAPGNNVIDGTVGDGGHAEAMAEAIAPNGKLLGLDLDPDALRTSAARLKRFGPRVLLYKSSFRNLADAVRAGKFPPLDAILLDLGLRSAELEKSGRGFSFLRDEPLDMRFDPSGDLTAAAIVNGWPKDELVRILREYGEERRARQIAERIVNTRRHARLLTTFQLVTAIGGPRGRIHPATRTFQALRIAVNDELGALRDGLKDAFQILKPGGRFAVISFHSLEDRIVKLFFRKCSEQKTAALLTKRPITPTDTEIFANPRSRSAKLRIIQKV